MPYRQCWQFSVCLLFLSSPWINASDIVAFNAYVTRTLRLHKWTHVNVVYDGLYYNYGNAYNRDNGFFTAPSDGLYVFSWTTYVGANNVFNTDLLLNGKRQSSANCDNAGNPGRENCSYTVPLVLKTGDHVNIQTSTADVLFPTLSSFKGWRVIKTN